MSNLIALIDLWLGKLGLVRRSRLISLFDYNLNISKLLDEHRETVEDIAADTQLLRQKEWVTGHLAKQDDNLVGLFYITHGHYPEESLHPPESPKVRPRPLELGMCQLPGYWRKGHK